MLLPLHRRTPTPPRPPSSTTLNFTSIGTALVLVVLPSAALMLGLHALADLPAVGLPLLAIFGIVILLGALAMMSSLFARLGLANRDEALGLPPGSIRAAIALALIVLFALIAVMLYQSLGGGRALENVSAADKDRFLADPRMHVTTVTPVPCPPSKSAAECSGYSYTLHLQAPASTAAADLAKQLLTLIGTLMTSVVSYYFAARASESAMRAVTEAVADNTPAPAADRAAPQAPLADLSPSRSL